MVRGWSSRWLACSTSTDERSAGPPEASECPLGGPGAVLRGRGADMMAGHDALTLVLDIGKSHAKLLMIDAAGAVVEQHGRANRSVMSSLGYPALDIAGLTQWIVDTLQGSSATRRCGRAIASTHGAAFVALDDDGLAWDPIDYEFDADAGLHAAYTSERDAFAATLAPDLPAGLNAARQLYWM